MTLCPIALMAGCKSCPMVSLCPLKSVLGDYKPGAPDNKPGTGDGQKRDG